MLNVSAASSAAWAQPFAPAATYPTVAGTRPYGLALGDINGDGVLDIVAGDNNGGLHTASVLLGQSGGSFSPPTAYPAASGSFGLALGDMNQDGRLDLVTSYAGPFAVGVQLGQVGGFGATTSYPTLGGISQQIALGDVNNDGRLDAVVANLGTNNVSVLLGQASGFARATLYSTGPNSQPFSVALGDLNGDGRLDIVTGNCESATIGVLLGQAGGFAPAVNYSAFKSRLFSTAIYLIGISLADVDSDGQLDVVATTGDTTNTATVGVLLGQAGGLLRPVTHYTAPGFEADGLTTGDVNGDGWADIVLATPWGNAAGVLLGYPGGFSLPFIYSTGAASSPWGVALADVNNDSRLDIVTTNSSASVSVLLSSPPLAQTVTTTAPGSGAIGSTISLNGSNLQGAVAVVFDGTSNRTVSSGFTVNAAGTQITGIVVPAGAISGRLRIVTPNGTVTSNTAFTIQTPTASRPSADATSMMLHPNPAQASALLSLTEASSARPVLLRDMLGRSVRQQVLAAHTGTLPLDLTGLPAGVYAVQCGTATTRLVVE
ncbi:FG-GAP-like repeat-containing protein [Hymenobacter ruber]